jgi:hypothetical protein
MFVNMIHEYYYHTVVTAQSEPAANITLMQVTAMGASLSRSVTRLVTTYGYCPSAATYWLQPHEFCLSHFFDLMEHCSVCDVYLLPSHPRHLGVSGLVMSTCNVAEVTYPKHLTAETPAVVPRHIAGAPCSRSSAMLLLAAWRPRDLHGSVTLTALNGILHFAQAPISITCSCSKRMCWRTLQVHDCCDTVGSMAACCRCPLLTLLTFLPFATPAAVIN